MEDLEAQNKIIELGKKIVRELKLDPGVDTLSKWMAHYLAEKITFSENLIGRKKIDSEKECCEIILKIWEYRWTIPNNKPFYNDFTPLMKTLEMLNPKREIPFFYNRIKLDNKEELNIFFNNALKIDKIARSLIFDLLSQGINNAEINDEKKDLLTMKIIGIDYLDNQILQKIYNRHNDIEDNIDDNIKDDIKTLKNKIQDLEEFSSIKNLLLKKYKNKLFELNKQSKSNSTHRND